MKKTALFFAMAVIVVFFLEYGLFSGLGPKPGPFLLTLDIVIWGTFFWGKRNIYAAAFIGGFLADLISPYRFGSVMAAMLVTLVVTDFLSTRIFTNRALYSYLFISFSSISAYFLLLLMAGVFDLLVSGAVIIAPLSLSPGDVLSVYCGNLILLSLLFLTTNAVTKKMHAAFIVR